MTAPAEDPRGGIGPFVCGTCTGRGGSCGTCRGSGQVWSYVAKPYFPPAAGRGDTDSSGETWRPVCGCEQGMGHMDRGCHSYGLCHAQSAERAARPAGDRAQPTEELREALVAAAAGHRLTTPRQCACGWREEGDGWERRETWPEHVADAVLDTVRRALDGA